MGGAVAVSKPNGVLWTAALIVFVLPIFLLIWNGYHGVWADQFPDHGMKFHITGATATSLFIWIGTNIVSRFKLSSIEAKRFITKYAWIVPYVILFFLSGIGIFNSMYQSIEGKFILVEKIEEVDLGLEKLGAAGSAAIASKVTEYEKFRGKVTSDLEALKKEIFNDNGKSTCGIGPSAEKVIDRIKKDLPSFIKLSGSSEIKCANRENLERIWNNHEALGQQLLRDSPVTRAAGIEAKQRLAQDLEQSVAARRKSLGEARKHLLEGVQLVLDPPSTQKAKTVIRDAARTYTEYQLRVSQIAPLSLPTTIDISDAENLGQTLMSLTSALGRFDRGRVAGFFVLALLIDFAVILVIQKLNELVRASQAQRATIVPSAQPTFLWSPIDRDPPAA